MIEKIAPRTLSAVGLKLLSRVERIRLPRNSPPVILVVMISDPAAPLDRGSSVQGAARRSIETRYLYVL
jgi:hypothetical protein